MAVNLQVYFKVTMQILSSSQGNEQIIVFVNNRANQS